MAPHTSVLPALLCLYSLDFKIIPFESVNPLYSKYRSSGISQNLHSISDAQGAAITTGLGSRLIGELPEYVQPVTTTVTVECCLFLIYKFNGPRCIGKDLAHL